MPQEKVTNTGQRVMTTPAKPKQDVIFDQGAQPGLGGLAKALQGQRQQMQAAAPPQIEDIGAVDPSMLPPSSLMSLEALMRLIGGGQQ